MIELIARSRNHDTTHTCAVSGDTLPQHALLRFVQGAEGQFAPDLDARLPGPAIWIRADRTSFRRALQKKLLPQITRTLEHKLENMLLRKTCGLLGMARKAGWINTGFDAVHNSIKQKCAAILILARNSSADGQLKLSRLYKKTTHNPIILDDLSSTELSMALGRGNVVYASLKPCPLARRIQNEALRLNKFRSTENSL